MSTTTMSRLDRAREAERRTRGRAAYAALRADAAHTGQARADWHSLATEATQVADLWAAEVRTLAEAAGVHPCCNTPAEDNCTPDCGCRACLDHPELSGD